ncbi:MAG: M48 family metalloprotease [Saprospiraceae bacterium]|nr:M48 family metalloprotease [Saprospiraceae bacterium]
MFIGIYDSLRSAYYAFFVPTEKGITPHEVAAIKERTDKSFRLADAESDRDLIKLFTHLYKKAGLIRQPKLIIYESNKPNATCLHTGSIMLSTELLDRQTKAELAATLAHEITHLAQKKAIHAVDILQEVSIIGLTTLIGVSVAKRVNPKERASTKGILLIGTSLALGERIVRRLLDIPAFMFQRACEFDADRGAVILTENPEALITNLQNYDTWYQSTQNPDTPVKGQTFLNRLYSNHPTTQERIAHVQQLKRRLKMENSKIIR